MLHLPLCDLTLAGTGLIVAIATMLNFANAANAEETTLARFAVNEYFDMPYEREPVSFDIELDAPVSADRLGLTSAAGEALVHQVEVLEGDRGAVRRARLWTLVSFDEPGQQIVHVVQRDAGQQPSHETSLQLEPAEGVGDVEVAVFRNDVFAAKVVTGSVAFDVPASPFALPGPVMSVAREDGRWIGSSYLDAMLRVRAIRSEVERGPVYLQSTITYTFENDRTYRVQARLYEGKPYVQLTEDFDLGGHSKFVFSFNDWPVDQFFLPGDQRLADWSDLDRANPTGDYITIEGQKALARMMVWSQFNYFAGKQETLGVRTAERKTAVGGFYVRPDQWTRAKINHIDLYQRPEVAGDRMSRGMVGLAGAEDRIALEAWLLEGHRRWALFAVDAEDDRFFAKAHVQEGVWPLDRINRLPLVWNGDGSAVTLEETAPAGELGYAGFIRRVLVGTEGRSGLQLFNGSNPEVRQGLGSQGLIAWAREHQKPMAGDVPISQRMVGPAMLAYMAIDESAYPGYRAMLPWTHPEALNPTYQGMENQNFNADLYRGISAFGRALVDLGHPEGERFLAHGEQQMDMALDRYAYPQSGMWEESHTYAAHTMHNLIPLARQLRDAGLQDFFDDIRFARMFEVWTRIHSPRDAQFDGKRVPPPVGDHGVDPDRFMREFRDALPDFARSDNRDIQRIASHMAWLILEKNHELTAEVEPTPPDLTSGWHQGYGSTLRASDDQERETFTVLRAGQSWGHHHMDKARMFHWARNVHFFGNAAWTAPPGGTYGNAYKQGPAGGTQIEFKGVSNWILPAKYAAGFISDDAYHPGVFDYANARNIYPFNPALDLSRSTPAVGINAYDRQVMLVHPDLLIVRDNVRTMGDTVWRLHSYQVDDTQVDGLTATLGSPEGVTGHLAIVHPTRQPGFDIIERDDLNGTDQPFGRNRGVEDDRGRAAAYDTRSLVLKWDMPGNTSATWVFGVSEDGESEPQYENLDEHGRVTRIRLDGDREIIVLMNLHPFTWAGEGITFEGSVGLVVRENGQVRTHPIRAQRLEAN
ncbi:MAG: hypothetical protein WD534_02575 [Phycisphaeraceae bacterium]